MKWVFSFIYFCCALSVFSAPWGAMIDYDLAAPPQGTHITESLGEAISQTPGERFLLKPVLEGKSIKIFLNPGAESEETLAVYRDQIKKAYAAWFVNAAGVIRKTKREHEFSDILPILDRGISVEFVEENGNIIFDFVDRQEISGLCGWGALACYFREEDPPVIFIPKNPRGSRSFLNPFGSSSGKELARSLVHEIGHSLGFSDQYARARGKTHAVYHGDIRANTVMNSSYKLTCDDADGIVNLIDITHKNRRGGKTGWRSLCAKSQTYYIGGMALGNGPYVILPKDPKKGIWAVRKYQNGNMAEEKVFAAENHSGLLPWEDFPERVLERDVIGRPVLTSGQHGETVYYSYLYGRTLRLVTAGGKFLLLEQRNINLPGEKKFEKRELEFARNGRVASLRSEHCGAEGHVFYREGFGPEELSLQIDFKKGKVVGNRGKMQSDWGRNIAAISALRGGPIVVGVADQMRQSELEKLEKILQQWYLRQ